MDNYYFSTTMYCKVVPTGRTDVKHLNEFRIEFEDEYLPVAEKNFLTLLLFAVNPSP